MRNISGYKNEVKIEGIMDSFEQMVTEAKKESRFGE